MLEKGVAAMPWDSWANSGHFRDISAAEAFCREEIFFDTMVQQLVLQCLFNNHRSAGPMARRLTTNQEIAGSIPASINIHPPSKGGSLLPFCTLQIVAVHQIDATVVSSLQEFAPRRHPFWTVYLQSFAVAVLVRLLLVLPSVVEVARTIISYGP